MREAILEVRTLEYDSAEGSHSGLVRPPAKRVGGVEPPRGFESRTLRHSLDASRQLLGQLEYFCVRAVRLRAHRTDSNYVRDDQSIKDEHLSA